MEVLKVDYTAEDAAQQLAKSIRETGFAIIKNHPIDPTLIRDVQKDWEAFYALPLSEKNKWLHTVENPFGYFPYKLEVAKGHNVANLMEFFHYNDHSGLPDMLSGKTKQLFDKGYEMVLQLAAWLEQETPAAIREKFEMPIPEMLKNCRTSIMRIIHYPALEGNEEPDAIRAAEHEDINILTVLPAATTRGLEAKDVEGNWHAVEPDVGTIVINAGDMLQMLTEGYYKSTTHRVVNPPQSENKPRYSIPMFFQARDEVKLSKDYTAIDYWNERMAENNILTK